MATLLLATHVSCKSSAPIVAEEEQMESSTPTVAEEEQVDMPPVEFVFVDYFKAFEERFYPPELATDDNGFRDFIRLFGMSGYEISARTGDDVKSHRRQIYEKLGLDPDIPLVLRFPFCADRAVNIFYMERGERMPLVRFGLPWTLEDFPMLADWVNEIDEPLDAIAEAIRKPVFFAPKSQSPDSVEPDKPLCLLSWFLMEAQMYRSIARTFQARAVFRIGQGNIDGAIDDKLTILRFSRHITRSGSVVSHLVGIAIEDMAMAIPVGANPEYPLTERQIRRILEGIDALPPMTPISDALEGDRLVKLSQVQEFFIAYAQGGEAFAKKWAEWELGEPPTIRHPLNWDIAYRRINEAFDALQEPPPHERLHALIEESEEMLSDVECVDQLSLIPGGIEMVLSDYAIASLIRGMPDIIEEAIHRSQCLENMQRLVLAMMLYRLERGRMPDGNWVMQIAPYLGRNAERYFSCQTNPSPRGRTTYALVNYGNNVPSSHETILLVELSEPVPFNRAVISPDEVLALFRDRERNLPHPGGMNTARQSGAVMFIMQSINEAELRRLLGR